MKECCWDWGEASSGDWLWSVKHRVYRSQCVTIWLLGIETHSEMFWFCANSPLSNSTKLYIVILYHFLWTWRKYCYVSLASRIKSLSLNWTQASHVATTWMDLGHLSGTWRTLKSSALTEGYLPSLSDGWWSWRCVRTPCCVVVRS